MIDEKPQRRWWTTGSGGERGEQIETFLFISPPSRRDERHDGVGPIFMWHHLQKLRLMKVGTQKRRKSEIYYGKVCIRPSKVG